MRKGVAALLHIYERIWLVNRVSSQCPVVESRTWGFCLEEHFGSHYGGESGILTLWQWYQNRKYYLLFLTAVCDWKATLCLVLYQVSIVVSLFPISSVFHFCVLSSFSWQCMLKCMQVFILNFDVFLYIIYIYIDVYFHTHVIDSLYVWLL